MSRYLQRQLPSRVRGRGWLSHARDPEPEKLSHAWMWFVPYTLLVIGGQSFPRCNERTINNLIFSNFDKNCQIFSQDFWHYSKNLLKLLNAILNKISKVREKLQLERESFISSILRVHFIFDR